MRKTLWKLYDSIRLNLGIKRALSSVLLRVSHAFDEHFLLPIFQTVNKRLYLEAAQHYGADYRWDDQKSQNINKENQSFGYGLVHYSIVRNQRPTRILCIGSMYGFIPYMLAKACMENNHGHVDFVDAGFDINDPGDTGRHIFGQGFWRKVEPKKHFSYLLNSKYITTHVMTTQSFARKFPNRKYDYIYLDGDHRYRGAKSDFQTFWPRLKEGGFISLHDIHFDTTAGGIRFEQWKLWEELVKKYPYKIEFYNKYSGLGIIQKLTARPKRFQKPLLV